MKKPVLILIISCIVLLSKAQPVNVMLVTGGNEFDTVQFFQMFDEMEGVEYQHFEQPLANKTIENGLAEYFDVLIFYDKWESISINEKNAYIELTKKGKSFLFLHHSLASYQKWNEFEKIVGGKYIEEDKDITESEQSTFDNDIWVYIQKARNHPITRGIESLRFFDEIYGNIRISENVTPLLTTTHPKSSKIVGWENKYNLSKIIYLQSGNDHRSFEEKDFRKLIKQTIKYLATNN